MATQIINGVLVARKDEGTVFGDKTLTDRVQNTDGTVKKDILPLTFGGLATVDPAAEEITSTKASV